MVPSWCRMSSMIYLFNGFSQILSLRFWTKKWNLLSEDGDEMSITVSDHYLRHGISDWHAPLNWSEIGVSTF